MTRIEEFAPASEPASLGLVELTVQRSGVIHGSQQQREVPAVLVRVACDIDGPRLDQDCPEQGRAGEFHLSSFQQQRDLSAAFESLRPASHGNGPAGRDREQGGSWPDAIRGEEIDNGVGPTEPMGQPIRRRRVEHVPEAFLRRRSHLCGTGQGTDIDHDVDVSARPADRQSVFVGEQKHHLRPNQRPGSSRKSRRQLGRGSPDGEFGLERAADLDRCHAFACR